METFTGIGACRGVAVGAVLLVDRAAVQLTEPPEPMRAFTAAVEAVRGELGLLEQTALGSGRTEAAEVLGAQRLMAEDPMLAQMVGDSIAAGTGLQASIEAAAAQIADMLRSLPDEYLAARSADVLEVADRVVRHLAGVAAPTLAGLVEPSVVVAKVLTAAETSQLDPAAVLGFVTEEGGATSHVAVIARSLGIPAVVGAGGVVAACRNASSVGLDGSDGTVIVDPDLEAGTDFQRRAQVFGERRRAEAAYRGRRVRFGEEAFTVAANVAGPADVARAVEAKADGIGLYRTEFLFLDRDESPSEEEQYSLYAAAANAFDDPVVVRTFDIGGDKPAAYLDLPREENPFLGERGVRVYASTGDLLTTQIHALLRASAHGDLWVMIPMIATVDDFLGVKRLVDETSAALAAAGVEVGTPRLGAMIEVPSAALIADRLAEHVDFFSIGTNDLTQYVMAADRVNGRLGRYTDAAHPAVLRLCEMTARAGAAAGVPVSVCGSAAADPTLAVLFAAMGITKLSVAPPSVDLVKATIAESSPERALAWLGRALDATDAVEVRAGSGVA